MTALVYLDAQTVVDKRQTAAPHDHSRSGYGSKLPTTWQLKLKDNRWRRVYVMQYSNAGSAYILVKGETVFLGSYDPKDGG